MYVALPCPIIYYSQLCLYGRHSTTGDLLPKNSIDDSVNSHLDAFAYSRCSHSLPNIFLRCSVCSFMLREYTRILSKKIRTNLSRYSPRRSFIIPISCTEALVSRKGVTKYSYSPHRVLNVVFWMFSRRISTCQYPNSRSILLNNVEPPSRSNNSLGRVMDLCSWPFSCSANGCQCKNVDYHPSLAQTKLGLHRVILMVEWSCAWECTRFASFISSRLSL